MRKAQKDIHGLGAIGIARESFKVWSTHSKVFTLIQLTFILPVTLLTVAGELFISWKVHQGNQPTGTSPIPNMPRKFGISISEAGMVAVVAVLIMGVVSIVSSAILTLPAAATLQVVGLHYTGQSVSLRGVLRASIPRLWMRLFCTTVYSVLITYALLMVQTLFSLLLVRYRAALSLTVMLLGIAAMALLILVGAFILDLFFSLAAGVSVLEKDYGWAAVGRASKLLKGRLVVAILFRLLWLVPGILLIVFQRIARYAIPREDSSPLRFTAFVLAALASAWLTSFVFQISALAAGVQYASFKAFHNEDLAESIYEKQVMKGGYEPVGDETGDDAKLGGKNAETLV